MLLDPQTDSSSPKRSLILAGGGMRVAYQAGVLRALEEEALSFHHVDGTSGGTMNTAMLFSGVSPVEMCERWSTLKTGDFVSFLPLAHYFKPHKLKAMGDADGIIEKVFPHLGIDLIKLNQAQANSQATFNVCNHSTKQNLQITNEDVTLAHLIAGISLPIFMPAIEIDGDMFTDSVWIKDANLIDAVKRGAEELWLVWCIGNSHDFKDNSFLQYVHMIELSANGALLEEYDRILELNERIKKGDSPYGQKQPIKLHVIKPPFPIPLDPDLYFGRISGQELVNMGYQHGKMYLTSKHEDGVSFDWRATHMEEPRTTAISRMCFKTHTKNCCNWIKLGLRAEAYFLEPGKVPGYDRPLALYADITLDDFDANLPAISGEMVLSEKSGGFKFQAQFNASDPVSISGEMTTVALWKMFFGYPGKINLEILKNNETLDTACFRIFIFKFLYLLMKIQIKESSGVMQSLSMKWKFARRLFTN
jgi:predicted acylesterase/phospholipase RssA